MHYRTIVDAQNADCAEEYAARSLPESAASTRTCLRRYAATEHENGHDHGRSSLRRRRTVSFAGDPQASPRGWVEGTETAGNNTVTGTIRSDSSRSRPKRQSQRLATSVSLCSSARDLRRPTAFKDAATTNLFYWINRTHDFSGTSGFDEAAGNFQQDNWGGAALAAIRCMRTASSRSLDPGTALMDNSAFSFWNSTEDGFPWLRHDVSRRRSRQQYLRRRLV